MQSAVKTSGFSRIQPVFRYFPKSFDGVRIRSTRQHVHARANKTPNSIQANGRHPVLQVRAAASTSIATSSTGEAAYIRRVLSAGDVEEHACSVVVLGDVPEGSKVVSSGDVVIMGALKGEVQAGSAGNSSAIVVALQKSASAKISIAGIAAPQEAGIGQMVVLEPGATQPTFKPMPGSAALAAPTEAIESGIQLSQVGTALVLILGVGLALAPATVLGTLLHTGAETAVAALLEVAVYGYILLQGANLLGDGSEMLLEILNPGVIGGVVLPLLGAVPDSLIILNAGLHAAPEDAQQEVAVGVGTLAGSTIMLLSLAWGGSILLGSCDLTEKGVAKDKTLTRGWDLDNTGVTVDEGVRKGALVMAISVLLYGFVQVPAILGRTDDPEAALIGGVTCLLAAAGYCVYSVLDPERQKRRIEAAQKKRFRQYAVKALALKADDTSKYGGLLDSKGFLNSVAVSSLFDEFDEDKSGFIDTKELQGLMTGLGMGSGTALAEIGGAQASMEYLFEEFDVNKDKTVTKEEFEAVLKKWVEENLGDHGADARMGHGSFSSLVDPARAQALLKTMPPADVEALKAIAAELEGEDAEEAADDMEGEEGAGAPLTASAIALQASLKLGAGVALCAVFSDPLVDALSNLSRVTGVPPFFVGFVLTPLASNASELVSSLQFAARKRKKNMSLTFSQVYGAVTMNNTLVLGLFLLVVYWQRLEWVYSSEVLVIVAASLLVGALGYSQSTFKTKLAIPALAIYPVSLLTVYLLDTFLGWQ